MTPSLSIGIIGGGVLPIQWGLPFEEVPVETAHGKPSSTIVRTHLHEQTSVYSILRHGAKHAHGRAVNYLANVEALAQLGCNVVISVSLAGSLVDRFDVGQTVLYDDVIDFRRLTASFFQDGEAKHASVAPLVCRPLESQLQRVAAELSLPYGGTMVVIEGPRYSTRAESRMFAALGGDLICQTVTPECFLAREKKMCWCGVCLVTDRDTRDPAQLVSTQLIFSNMRRFEETFAANLLRIVERLQPYVCSCSGGHDAVPRETLASFPGKETPSP
jgi:5'-methylthioadenosine phosphorylase